MLNWIVVSIIALLLLEVSSCKNVQEGTRHEAAISKRSADEGCWFREEYRSCGTACPDTCENYGRNNSCTRECVPGCFCKKGYVRNSRSRFQMCILPEDCTNPPVCNREGEHFNKCGTKCPLTCNNMDDPPLCETSCAVGCFCNEGLVRNATGSCIHPGDCPPKGTRHEAAISKRSAYEGCWFREEYRSCGTACPDTCENYGRNNSCTRECIPGCFCKKGYVRNSRSRFQMCILPEDCTNPPVCNKEGEHFNKCGTKCPLTCNNMDDPPLCETSCAVGCICNEGLVRNATGSCIHPGDCPPKPPRVCATVGEKLDRCGCELKCTGRIGEHVNHCPEYCVQSCACKGGLARHPINGSCILPRNCPTAP